MRIGLFVLPIALTGAVAASPAAALNPRPTVDSPSACFGEEKGEVDCDGTLCSCCYNDGCWICNAGTPADCTWDPAYRGQSVPQLSAPDIGLGGNLRPNRPAPGGVLRDRPELRLDRQ